MKHLSIILLFCAIFLVACNKENTNSDIREVLFPPSFFTGLSKVQIEQDAKHSGAKKVDYVKNGAIIYSFCKKAWQQEFEVIENELKFYLADITINDAYPSILNATANTDYSQLKFVVDKRIYLKTEDRFAIKKIGNSATYYQLFLAKAELKVVVKVIDSFTAETIDTIVLPDEISTQ